MKKSVKGVCVCSGASEGLQFGVCWRAVKGLGSGWSKQQSVLDLLTWTPEAVIIGSHTAMVLLCLLVEW